MTTQQDGERIDRLITRVIGRMQEGQVDKRWNDPQYTAFFRLTARHKVMDFHEHYPLDLDLLEQVEDFHLIHDVFGLDQHWDVDEHTMTDCFWPRCMPKVRG